MRLETVYLYLNDLYLPAMISFVGCFALIALARFYPRLGGRGSDVTAIQAMHITLTSRVGGVAVAVAILCGIIIAADKVAPAFITLLYASVVLFVVGLGEDLGFEMPPKARLSAVVISSCIAIYLLDIWLLRIGVPSVDQVLSYWYVGIPFTLLITAGVANGFNLIDGVNGLASLTAMSAALALAFIAHQAGLSPIAQVAFIMVAAIFGFFVVNYPFGLIFLGDAGAYAIGFLLGWIGILILAGAPEVSPWAILLTVFWPLADTLLAMYRRGRNNRAAMQPDRLHVHQLVMRGIEMFFVGRNHRRFSNSLTTLVLAPFVVAPQIAALFLWDKNLAAFIAVLAFLAAFFSTYAIAISAMRARIRWRDS